jgi:hypothetical protein
MTVTYCNKNRPGFGVPRCGTQNYHSSTVTVHHSSHRERKQYCNNPLCCFPDVYIARGRIHIAVQKLVAFHAPRLGRAFTCFTCSAFTAQQRLFVYKPRSSAQPLCWLSGRRRGQRKDAPRFFNLSVAASPHWALLILYRPKLSSVLSLSPIVPLYSHG